MGENQVGREQRLCLPGPLLLSPAVWPSLYRQGRAAVTPGQAISQVSPHHPAHPAPHTAHLVAHAAAVAAQHAFRGFHQLPLAPADAMQYGMQARGAAASTHAPAPAAAVGAALLPCRRRCCCCPVTVTVTRGDGGKPWLRPGEALDAEAEAVARDVAGQAVLRLDPSPACEDLGVHV